MRTITKAVAVVTGLVALLVAIAVVVIANLDLNRYRADIEAAVQAVSGRKLTIDGDLTLTLGTPVALSVERVSLANAPWASRPEMLVLDHAEMDVALLPLLRRKLRIDHLALSGVTLFLETDAAGVDNWQFAPNDNTPADRTPAEAESAQGGLPLDLRIREIDLAGVNWTWRDAASKQSLEGSIDALRLSQNEPGGTIALALHARVGQAPLTASGTVGPLRALFKGTKPYPLSIKAEGPGVTASADGTIETSLSGRGIALAISIEGTDVAAAARKAGWDLPALPPLSLSGRLSGGEDGYALSGLRLKLGGSDAAGDVRVRLAGDRPEIGAKLASQRLDLVELAAIFDQGDQPAAADPPLPFDALRLADATIDVSAGTVIVQPDLSATDASLQAKLSQGQLTAGASFGHVSGGAMTANSTWNAADAAMSVQVLSEGVQAGALLRGFKASEALEGGPLNGRIELAGRGRTLGAWLASVDGRTDIVMGPAKQRNRLLGVFGADIVTEVIRTVNPFVKTEETTPIECGVLRSRISRGRMSFDRSVAVQTNRVGVIASGSVDLPSERLDVAIRSAAREGLGISVAGVASMFVRIGGTLDHPTIKADPIGGIADIAVFAKNLVVNAVTLDAGGILQLLRAEGDYCQVALGKAPPPSQGPLEAIGGAAKGAVQGIGRRLESLFGD